MKNIEIPHLHYGLEIEFQKHKMNKDLLNNN